MLLELWSELGWRIVAALGFGLVWLFLSSWLAARISMGEEGTFLNTLKYYFLSPVATLVVCAIAAAGIFIAGPSIGPVGVRALVAIAALLLCLLALAIPAHVYSSGYLRAFGFLLLSFVIGAVGNAGAQRLIFLGAEESLAKFQRELAIDPQEQIRPLLDALGIDPGASRDGSAAPAEPGSPAASDPDAGLPLDEQILLSLERLTALKGRIDAETKALETSYRQLADRREKVSPSDADAVGAFNRDAVAYRERNRALEDLRAQATRLEQHIADLRAQRNATRRSNPPPPPRRSR